MDGWIDGDKNDTERRKADNLFCSVSVRMLLTTDNYLKVSPKREVYYFA